MFCSTNSYVFLLFKESLEMQIVRDRLVPSETGQSFYGLVPVRRRYRGVVGRLNGGDSLNFAIMGHIPSDEAPP